MLLCLADRLTIAPLSAEQAPRQSVSQSYERNLGEGDPCGIGADGPVVPRNEDARFRRRVEELRMRLERLGNKDMREPVLRSAEQRQSVTGEKPHGLSTAGDRDVQGRLFVESKNLHEPAQKIGGDRVLVRGSDVYEVRAVRCTDDMNALWRKRVR